MTHPKVDTAGTGRPASPARLCAGCGAREVQSHLVRFVVGPDDDVVADLVNKKSFGRGVWVHPRYSCLERAGRNGLSKSLKRRVSLTAEVLVEAIRPAAWRRCVGLVAAGRATRTIVWGRDQVRQQVEQLELVVAAEDAGGVAQELWLGPLAARGRVCFWGDKATFGGLFGREEVAIWGVTDAGIAKALLGAIGLARLTTQSLKQHEELSEVQ